MLAFRCYLVSGAFETVRVGFDSSGVSLSCGGTGCSGSVDSSGVVTIRSNVRWVRFRFGEGVVWRSS